MGKLCRFLLACMLTGFLLGLCLASTAAPYWILKTLFDVYLLTVIWGSMYYQAKWIDRKFGR